MQVEQYRLQRTANSVAGTVLRGESRRSLVVIPPESVLQLLGHSALLEVAQRCHVTLECEWNDEAEVRACLRRHRDRVSPQLCCVGMYIMSNIYAGATLDLPELL